jgi:acyl-coenzyme A thioesterase PaaI-like protein
MPDRAAIQDFYPDDFAHCHGCGRLNNDGLHVKSRWEGDDMVARYTPRPDQIAMPGYVYGGLIASLIDCHAMATASAAVERAAGREIGERKVIVDATVSANGVVTAKGEIVAVRRPETMTRA